jgi:hypothetical protein
LPSAVRISDEAHQRRHHGEQHHREQLDADGERDISWTGRRTCEGADGAPGIGTDAGAAEAAPAQPIHDENGPAAGATPGRRAACQGV